MPEWYAKRIVPWVQWVALLKSISSQQHTDEVFSFIPVKIDYTDLYDILAFFIGDETGARGRDDLGERIGRQGKEWAETYWREVDMQGTTFHFLGGLLLLTDAL